MGVTKGYATRITESTVPGINRDRITSKIINDFNSKRGRLQRRFKITDKVTHVKKNSVKNKN